MHSTTEATSYEGIERKLGVLCDAVKSWTLFQGNAN
jgi:hypothetical protein